MTQASSHYSPQAVTAYHRDTKANKTGFLGLKFDKRWGRYQAYIRVHGRKEKLYVGQSTDPVIAAKMYDAKARELYGPSAVVNFPDET